MPAGQTSKKKTERKAEPKARKNDYANGALAEGLNKLAHDNPWRLFNVGEIRAIFDIGETAVTRLRKLASRDQSTDPWVNDKTRPEKFHAWLWGTRIDLEKIHRDI
jgi:hypothetical protein